MTRTKLIHDKLTYSVEVARQRLDMIVDQQLVIEIKSTRTLHDGSVRQVENYLRATRLELGLLLHFGPQPKFYRVICSSPAARGPQHSPSACSAHSA